MYRNVQIWDFSCSHRLINEVDEKYGRIEWGGLKEYGHE